MYISIEVYKGDDNSFIAACPELSLFSNGKTEKQAVDRLKEEIVVHLYVSRKKYTDAEIKSSRHLYRDGRPKIH
jgi:predicted RNase H-like HicB family nuclease